MNNIYVFIERNKVLSSGFIVSIIIVLIYLYSDIKDEWKSVLFQLSIGYMVNFLFYITQVYIPNFRRDNIIRQQIGYRIRKITDRMDSLITKLAEIYIYNHNKGEYTEKELMYLLRVNLNDKISCLDSSRTTTDNLVYFNVREWIKKCITETDEDIDKLFKYYGGDINIEITEALENILKSSMHTSMKVFLTMPGEISFKKCNVNFFEKYYKIALGLKTLNKKYYNM